MSPSAGGHGSRRRPGAAPGARSGAQNRSRGGGSGGRRGPGAPGGPGRGGQHGGRHGGRPDPAVYRRRRIAVGVLAVIVVALLVLGIVLMVKAVQKLRQDAGDAAAGDASASASPEPTLPAPTGKEASGACPTEAVEILAGTDKQSYEPGASAMLELTVKNNNTAACAISVGAQHQVFEIHQDGKTVWSTAYCAADPAKKEEDVRVFAPGTERKSALKWQMIPTDKNCNRTADSFKAGQYELVTKLGEVASKPAPFTVEEPAPEKTEKPEDEG